MLRVTAAIIERKGKVLICRRPQCKVMCGLWEFPGGKIELEETPEACLKRELNEELGINAEIGEHICSSSQSSINNQIELIAYRVHYPEGSIELREHEDAKWIHISEHSEYDFAPADISIIDHLLPLYSYDDE